MPATRGRRRRARRPTKRGDGGGAGATTIRPERVPAGGWVPLLAALVPLLVFWHTTRFGFIMDDVVLFQKSASLTDLGSIPRGFLLDVGAVRKGSDEPLGTFYRPVFLALSTSYYQLVGGGTFGWHLASVAVAGAVGALAALFFLRLGFAAWPSLLGAAVFSLHPAHVGSVAWAAGLQDQVAAVFVLASLLALLRPDGEAFDRRAVVVGALGFVLALLSKEVAIALLPMTAIWAWSVRRHDPLLSRRLVKAAAAMAGCTLVYLAVRIAVLGSLAKPWPRAPGMEAALSAVPLAFATYVRMLLWPLGFSFFRPERPVWGPLDPPVLIASGALAVLAVGAWLAIRARRALLLPVAWFVVWLAPVLNFWALGPEWMVTDRYLFLPSLALPWALLAVLPRRPALAVLGVLAMAFAGLSVRYAAIFADERTFYAAMEKAEPTSSFVQAEKARLLRNEGKRAAAEAALRRALELDPRESTTLQSLGDLALERGDLAAAEQLYRRAVALDPAASKSFKQLALALSRSGEERRAAALVAESSARWPADFQVQLLHALFLARAGDRGRAVAAFEAARRLRPDDPAVAGGFDPAMARLAPMVLARSRPS